MEANESPTTSTYDSDSVVEQVIQGYTDSPDRKSTVKESRLNFSETNLRRNTSSELLKTHTSSPSSPSSRSLKPHKKRYDEYSDDDCDHDNNGAVLNDKGDDDCDHDNKGSSHNALNIKSALAIFYQRYDPDTTEGVVIATDETSSTLIQKLCNKYQLSEIEVMEVNRIFAECSPSAIVEARIEQEHLSSIITDKSSSDYNDVYVSNSSSLDDLHVPKALVIKNTPMSSPVDLATNNTHISTVFTKDLVINYTQISPVMLKDFTINNTQISSVVINKTQTSRVSLDNSCKCAECGDAPPMVRCLNCEEDFCTECADILHRPKTFAKHKRISISPRPLSPPLPSSSSSSSSSPPSPSPSLSQLPGLNPTPEDTKEESLHVEHVVHVEQPSAFISPISTISTIKADDAKCQNATTTGENSHIDNIQQCVLDNNFDSPKTTLSQQHQGVYICGVSPSRRLLDSNNAYDSPHLQLLHDNVKQQRLSDNNNNAFDSPQEMFDNALSNIQQILNTSVPSSSLVVRKDDRLVDVDSMCDSDSDCDSVDVDPTWSDLNWSLDICDFSDGSIDIKSTVKRFYGKYNPERIPEIPKVLAAYAGEEKQLLKGLCQRYNVPEKEMQRYMYSTPSDTAQIEPTMQDTKSYFEISDIFRQACNIFPNVFNPFYVDEGSTSHTNGHTSGVGHLSSKSSPIRVDSALTNYFETVKDVSPATSKGSNNAVDRAHTEYEENIFFSDKHFSALNGLTSLHSASVDSQDAHGDIALLIAESADPEAVSAHNRPQSKLWASDSINLTEITLTETHRHELLTLFYLIHGPNQISRIPQILDYYKGDDVAMIQSLIQQYRVSNDDMTQMILEIQGTLYTLPPQQDNCSRSDGGEGGNGGGTGEGVDVNCAHSSQEPSPTNFRDCRDFHSPIKYRDCRDSFSPTDYKDCRDSSHEAFPFDSYQDSYQGTVDAESTPSHCSEPHSSSTSPHMQKSPSKGLIDTVTAPLSAFVGFVLSPNHNGSPLVPGGVPQADLSLDRQRGKGANTMSDDDFEDFEKSSLERHRGKGTITQTYDQSYESYDDHDQTSRYIGKGYHDDVSNLIGSSVPYISRELLDSLDFSVHNSHMQHNKELYKPSHRDSVDSSRNSTTRQSHKDRLDNFPQGADHRRLEYENLPREADQMCEDYENLPRGSNQSRRSSKLLPKMDKQRVSRSSRDRRGMDKAGYSSDDGSSCVVSLVEGGPPASSIISRSSADMDRKRNNLKSVPIDRHTQTKTLRDLSRRESVVAAPPALKKGVDRRRGGDGDDESCVGTVISAASRSTVSMQQPLTIRPAFATPYTNSNSNYNSNYNSNHTSNYNSNHNNNLTWEGDGYGRCVDRRSNMPMKRLVAKTKKPSISNTNERSVDRGSNVRVGNVPLTAEALLQLQSATQS